VCSNRRNPLQAIQEKDLTVKNDCSFANLFAACWDLRRYPGYVIATAASVCAVYAFGVYLSWVTSKVPAFDTQIWAVFSLGPVSTVERLEMLPAQVFVVLLAAVFCGFTGMLFYWLLSDLCQHGARVRKLKQESVAR
jgi:hypothetical protein